jgi:hypothetical protein
MLSVKVLFGSFTVESDRIPISTLTTYPETHFDLRSPQKFPGFDNSQLVSGDSIATTHPLAAWPKRLERSEGLHGMNGCALNSRR